jgi:hypothetical protein
MGSMWLTLVAALACVLPTSPRATPAETRAVGATMSLPLDAGPASAQGDWRSVLAPLPHGPMSEGLAFADGPSSPLDIDCIEDATPAADCGTSLASIWSPIYIPRCDLPRPSHGRPGVVRRGRGRTVQLFANAGLRDAPAPLAADPTPPRGLCAPPVLLPPSTMGALPLPAALAMPPAPPHPRLDRPPRLAIV